MEILRDKSSIRSYYSEVIGSGLSNEEGLTDPVAEDFINMLASVSIETPRKALDLGYGVGNYSIALAREGFNVQAVDQIPACYLRNRLSDSIALSCRIEILEIDIENFTPTGPYGVVVAKDVLHFLGKVKVEELLGATVQASERPCCHYLKVFTDIERTSIDGVTIRIEGEADYSAKQFTETIERLYQGWETAWDWAEYKERDRRVEGKYYFKANRATAISIMA